MYHVRDEMKFKVHLALFEKNRKKGWSENISLEMPSLMISHQ